MKGNVIEDSRKSDDSIVHFQISSPPLKTRKMHRSPADAAGFTQAECVAHVSPQIAASYLIALDCLERAALQAAALNLMTLSNFRRGGILPHASLFGSDKDVCSGRPVVAGRRYQKKTGDCRPVACHDVLSNSLQSIIKSSALDKGLSYFESVKSLRSVLSVFRYKPFQYDKRDLLGV